VVHITTTDCKLPIMLKSNQASNLARTPQERE